MKIPTSTSFVMAATASLALQSSALALPQPDSPVPGGVSASPHSARTAPAAQFSGRAPAIRTDSGSRRSLPRRDVKLRDTDDTDAASSGSLSAEVGLGIKMLEAEKDADAPAIHSNTTLVARQVPVPAPGVPGPGGSVTIPAQIVGGVTQEGPSYIPAEGAASVPGQIIGTSPFGNCGATQGGGQNTPNPIGVAGGVVGGLPVVGGTAGGVIQGVPNPLSTVQGFAGSLPLSQVTGAGAQVPAGNLPLNELPNPLAAVRQQLENTPAVAGTGVPGTMRNDVAPFDAKQAQTQADGTEDGSGNEDGTVSPSSTIATPSSSPVFTSSTDYSPPSPSDSASAVPTPVVNIAAPLSSAPVAVPTALIGSLIPSGAPTPSLPVSEPSRAAGPPAYAAPSVPVSPPFSVPSSVPASQPPASSLPVSLPVAAPVPSGPLVFIRARRTLSITPQLPSAPTSSLPLPSGFPAPSAPIPNDTPPLLQAASVGAKDAVSADKYPASSTSFDDQVSAASTAQPESSTLSMSSSMGATTTASSLSSRRRFFRFNREENA